MRSAAPVGPCTQAPFSTASMTLGRTGLAMSNSAGSHEAWRSTIFVSAAQSISSDLRLGAVTSLAEVGGASVVPSLRAAMARTAAEPMTHRSSVPVCTSGEAGRGRTGIRWGLIWAARSLAEAARSRRNAGLVGVVIASLRR